MRRPNRRQVVTGGLAVVGGALAATVFGDRDRGDRSDRRPAQVVNRDAPRLDRLAVKDGQIRDSSGRQVVLRGFVTISAWADPLRFTGAWDPIELTAADFRKMRDWGFNFQSVRMEGCRLGAASECEFDPSYLDLLERWVTVAEQHGMYTAFKMTTYDVPSWRLGRAFSKERWQEFWDNKDGQQDVFLSSWSKVWRRFSGRPSVLGYDVVNEPHEGTRTGQLTRDHLYPFHRKASAMLREIDREAAYLFQPATLLREESQQPLSDPNPIFTSHFYPPRPDLHEQSMARLLRQQAQTGTAMLVGEYGYPDREFWFMPAWNVGYGRTVATLLDRHGFGSCWPWYVPFPNQHRSVLRPGGSERTGRLDVLLHPYPQRTAGTQNGWSFDFETKTFKLEIEPKGGVTAASEIFVAAGRHYSAGFRLAVNGATFISDETSKDGLRRLDSDAKEGIAFDRESEILRIDPRQERVTITIRPR
jgi:hypothetical protein